MAKTTAKTTKTTKTTNDPTVSTPVVRDTSAASLLGALTGKATSKKATKPERPEVQLSEYAEQLFSEFAPAKELADIFTERAENIKSQLTEEVFEEYVGAMWTGKSQPTNPALKSRNSDGRVDCEGIFIVQEKIKVQVPDPSDPSESTIALLVKSGVSEAVACKLVENEIDFTPQVGLRPFNELVSGHYEERAFIESSAAEQAVAQKILEFVTNELTEEEQQIVLRNEPKTVVKKGFLERVATYVGSENELKSVFRVLQPVNYPKGAKFAVGDTPVGKTNRLIGKASEILGSDSE
jgi:hypothetical protein